jgi:threonine dehydratase
MDLSLARIEEAARVIDPVFRNSPQFEEAELTAALGRRVLVKVETVNPVRSFKGRGADFKARFLDPRQEVVCASAGNFGQAVAYAGCRRGVAVTVFVPVDINPAKLARMKAFGAEVRVIGADGDEAKLHARRHAEAAPGRLFLEDGEDPAISEGAGTIGKELLEAGAIDAVVVPVGDGALIAGIALWLKAHSKATRIIGVAAAGAPAMVESWRAGKVASVRTETIADGLAVRTPIARSVERLRVLVDDMLLVDDASLLSAMRTAARTLGLILEPSGAAGLAAIAAHKIPGERLATILTGGNIHPDLAADLHGPSS